MALYLACTPDKYELPIYVTESAKEMADFLDVSVNTVYKMVSRKRRYDREGREKNGGKVHLFHVETEGEQKSCPTCGETFLRRSGKQIYCSNKCRQRMAYAIIKAKEGKT